MKAKAQKERSVSLNSRDRGRVLVISDEPLPLEPRSLKSTGLEIVGVSGSAAALVSLQRGRPHVVVASDSVKRMSTGELAKMLSQTQDGIPLILVGNETSTAERRRAALSAGAFDYFQLPAEMELVILRVTQLVKIRQTMDRLRGEADLDSLTGLANRRRFRTALNREVERWRRYGTPCALLLLDVDHMKAINDKYGHPAGDSVIRLIAATLTEVSRNNDTAARLGGEEFALLLAAVDAEKAALVAERLRAVLEYQSLPEVGNTTVSIGVASCPAQATSERSLYAASDGALYVAKNGGRNRLAVAPLVQEKLPGV